MCYKQTGNFNSLNLCLDTVYLYVQPIAADNCVALLLRIRMISGSNLGRESGYLGRGFSWGFLFFRTNAQNRLRLPHSVIFLIHNSLTIL